MSPTAQLLIAVLAFGEPFDAAVQLPAFALIWTGIALFLAEGVARRSIADAG